MKNYDAKEIEKKWQEYWKENNIYKTPNKIEGKKNFYALSEFAYPSGNLHVGHWYAFAVPDIYARFKRMNGYNVLYPIGFDAFGLPAENAAIKRGLDPKKWTYENMDYMKKQLISMGASFDWERTFATSDPEYYKWTQWMFTQFYKNGMVERVTTKANWCDSCKTVLANEQVVSGKCERCDADVVQKNMQQWSFKITDFADELIDDLDTLDWDESIKQAQREWIGRKEGSEISFQIKFPQDNTENKEDVLILHGWENNSRSGFIPETKKFLEKEGHQVFVFDQPNTDEPDFDEWFGFINKKIEENNLNDFSIIGHSMGGLLALKIAEKYNLKKFILVAPVGIEKPKSKYFHQFTNSLTENELSIFKKYQNRELNIERIKENIQNISFIFGKKDPWITSEIREFYINKFNDSSSFQIIEEYGHMGEYEGFKKLPELEKLFENKKVKVFTTRADTLFGVTYVVLAPEHSLVQELKDNIENWDDVQAYFDATAKKSDLERQQSKEKTGVFLKGIKAINPANGEEIPVLVADYVLAHFGTGAVMAVPAHDERDAEFALKFNLPFKFVVLPSAGEVGKERPVVTFGEDNFIKKAGDEKTGRKKIQAEWNAMYDFLNEVHKHGGVLPEGKRFGCAFKGKLINAKEGFNAVSTEEAIHKITEYVGGESKKTYRLRDWGISRQRYWGTPIPMVYDTEGKPHPIPDKHLPWLLPEDVDHTLDGTAPLARSQELKDRTEKIFGKGWTPEVETMDTFVDSSWYFYRYLDNKNEKEFASNDILKEWMPIEMYFGGAEHTTMHLLYSRFWTKALHKLGLVAEKEPYKGRLNRGLILGPDGAKMSKSKGNVIDPDDVVSHVGADALRMYLAFMGPFNEPGNYPWDPNGVVGVRRFLEKINRLVDSVLEDLSDDLKLNYNLNVKSYYEDIVNKKEVNKLIKNVSNEIERLKLNTAISFLMKHINLIRTEEKEGIIYSSVQKSVSIIELKIIVKLLSPFAPHLAEEFWDSIRGKEKELLNIKDWNKYIIEGSIHLSSWPSYNEKLVKDDHVELPVQVNGKLRGKFTIDTDTSEEKVREQAIALPEIQKWIEGKKIKKFIYVKGRIINIVV